MRAAWQRMSQQAGTECGHIQSQQWPCSLYTLLPSCSPPTRGPVKENQLQLRGNPAGLGRGCLGAAHTTRGSRSLTQHFCQSRHLDGVQPPLFPREYKKTSAEASNTTLLSAACSAPACRPPVRGQGRSKLEPKGPIPSSHLPKPHEQAHTPKSFTSPTHNAPT